ncbi:MAG: PorP/SprF family type IX secretion system membrane protein, partial [Bacteroidota bacterium]
MMRRIPLLIFLLSYFLPQIADGQDPVFSHVDANRLYYNPAFTGWDKGLRVAGGYRRQWPGIVSEYTAYNFSAEAQAFNIGGGIGLMLSQNTQGEGYLSRTRMGFCYSYQIVTRDYQLSFGTKVSSVRTSIDWSRLQFSDQLDPVYGNVYQTQALPPESPYRNFVDFDWGMALRFKMKFGDFKSINTFGASWLHSTRPD